MKVKAKIGLIYNGTVYKAGEVFEIDDKLNYTFTWLKAGRVVRVDRPTNDEPQDDLLAGDSADVLDAPNGLPPLETAPRKGKKNG